MSGLNGTVVLQLGGANNLSLSANGAFSFAATLASGASYNVTVASQPGTPAQNCVVSNGSGVIAAANVTDVSVTCANVPLTLASSTPASGDTGVARSIVPSLTFSTDVVASTAIPANVTLAGAGGDQTVTLAVSGARIDVTPASTLLAGATYTLSVGTGLRGVNGEAPSAPITITFTTVAGGWSTPLLLENTNGAAANPRVGIDAQGNALAVWQQNDGMRNRIRFNRYVPTTGWAGDAPVALGVAAASLPDVAIDGLGVAHLVFQQIDAIGINVYATRFVAPFGFALPGQISNDFSAGQAQVAVNADGRAALVWLLFEDVPGGGSTSTVWAANYLPGTGWTSPVFIDTFAVNGASITPQVAIDDLGRVTVVWAKAHSRDALFPRFDIWSNRYTTGGAWTGAQLIETDDEGGAGDPQIAASGTGDVMAVWHATDGIRQNVWAARRAAGGTWEAPVLIENAPGTVGFPQIAADGSGNAIAVWIQYTAAPHPDVMVNRYVAGSGWGSATAVEADDEAVDAPQIAMNASGVAQLVWMQFREGSRYEVMGNRFIPGTGWGGAGLISTGGTGPNNVASPQLAIDPTGIAQAIWLRHDGLRNNVWSSRFE